MGELVSPDERLARAINEAGLAASALELETTLATRALRRLSRVVRDLELPSAFDRLRNRGARFERE